MSNYKKIWYGDTPSEWKEQKIKYSMKIKNGKEVLTEVNNSDDAINVYGSGGVFKWTDKHLYSGESLLFGRKGTIGKPLFVNEAFWTVDTMYYTNFAKGAYPKYFYYLMCVFPWDVITTQTALPSVVGSDIENFNCSVPQYGIQKRIADYLDFKTSQLDSLITDKENLILLLEEKRQSIITATVTKGLNSNVKMKDSRVEWIDAIPDHWEEKKIKYIFYEVNDRNTDKYATLLSLFTSIGVRPRSDMEEKGNKAQTVINYKIVRKGDIVVNKLLAWMGAIGISDYEGVTSPDYDVYRALNPQKISNKYYHYYFRSHYFKGDCFKYGRGIMMMRWRTYPDQFKSIRVPLPPYSEQIEIANYLTEKEKEIENTINEIKLFIEKLKEYRQSLIYEAVTGKFDVCDFEVVL